MIDYAYKIVYIYKLISPNNKIYIGQSSNLNQKERKRNPHSEETKQKIRESVKKWYKNKSKLYYK